jgi:hypothetical protein
METIKDVINEKNDLPLLLQCIEAEIKRCRTIANSPIKGYGSAAEKQRKDDWRARAEELDDLKTRIAYAYL